MQFQYPQPGFHFSVDFELSAQHPSDNRFQEVSGLKTNVALAPAYEGAEVQLPAKIKYEDLVLKRGVFTDTGIRQWCIDAFEKFEFQPVNLTIKLLNADHMPMMSWYVVAAYPISWEISGFNAERSELMIESITLKYDHFKTLASDQ